MDFGLERYDLSKITRQIKLPEISTDPERPLTLIVRAAVSGNRDFANALFKLAQPADAATPRDEATARREIAQLYAGPVIVGWEHVTDGGEPVPFSIDGAQELVVQLLEHVPDVWGLRVRRYVDDVANFRPAPPVVDPVDLGKG